MIKRRPSCRIAGAALLVSLVAFGAPLTSASAAEPAVVYYVAVDGDDANSGTSVEVPFRTVQRCASVASAGDTCLLRGGTYRETVRPASSGAAGQPITFAPFQDEQVSVAGADVVTGWSLTEAVPAGLAGSGFAVAVQGGHVYESPVALNPDLLANQLFIDGQMVNEARWPNSGPNPLSPTRALAGPLTTADMIHDPDLVEPLGFWDGATVHITAGLMYWSHTAPVVASSPGQVTFDSPYVSRHAHAQCLSCAKPGNPYYLTGKLGALDAPGEWFYDAAQGRLYLWTPDGTDPAAHVVEAKQRDAAFDLRDRSHIEVRNLEVFAATLLTDETSSGNVLDGLTATYVSHYVEIPALGRTTFPLYRLSDSSQFQLDSGIILAGTNNVLRNSSVTFSAGNGVSVQGRGNVVEDNVISEAAYGGAFTAPVLIGGLGGSEDHQILRNTLFNSGTGAGIMVSNMPDAAPTFRNIRIAYNDVSNLGTLTHDGGQVYVCCNLDSGVILDHNWFHDHLAKVDRYDVQGPVGQGIYFDLSSRNSVSHHNVMWNNGGSAFRLNAGHASAPTSAGTHLVYNNVMGGGHRQSLAFGGRAADAHGTEFVNNIYRAVAPPIVGATSSNNLPDTVDPLFVDPARGDHHLSASSPAIDFGAVVPGVTDGYAGAAPDAGAYEVGGTDWTPGCTRPACKIVTIDDSDRSGTGSLLYTGTGWRHCSECDAPTEQVNTPSSYPYRSTLSGSSTADDTMTMSFSGTGVQLHALTGPGRGIAAISVDDGPETLVDTWAPTPGPSVGTRRPAGAGDQIVWRSGQLPAGTHTLKVRVTGTRRPARPQDRNRCTQGGRTAAECEAEMTDTSVFIDRVGVFNVPTPGHWSGWATLSTTSSKPLRSAPRQPSPPGRPVREAETSPAPPILLWTDPMGDASPAFLDLAAASIACGKGVLTFELSIPDLDLDAAEKLSSYYAYRVVWHSGGTSYFADAAFGYTNGSRHRTAFFDGTLLPDGTPLLRHEITGSIVEGAEGRARIEVPIGNVGGAGTLGDVRAETLEYPFYAYSLGLPVPQPQAPAATTVDVGGPGAAVTYTEEGCVVVEESASLSTATTFTSGLGRAV